MRALFRSGSSRQLPTREAYALWADSYPPWPHNPLMRLEQDIVAPLIASTSPVRALDVGTGSGRCLPILASTGARLVAGIDFSLPMLARQTSGLPRVCGDACRLPFRDASFDLVSSSLMVGDLADIGGWIAEVARVLATGGQLIYSDFHPAWTAGRWRRTFESADGRSFELAYCSHAIAEHVAALEQGSFDVRAVHEPRLAGPAGDAPVLVVFHAVKRA